MQRSGFGHTFFLGNNGEISEDWVRYSKYGDKKQHHPITDTAR